MKTTIFSAFAIAAGLSTALPAVAQQTFTREAGETAEAMASRINACGGTGFTSAAFANDGALLRVQCVGGAGLEGGLGTAAAVAGGVIAVAAIASNSGSSSSTTTTSATGTTGTP